MKGPLLLLYDSIVVGEISDTTFHQGTWFGMFRQKIEDRGGTTVESLQLFIDFCKTWHDRLKAGADVDASDFDKFIDRIKSGLWKTRSADGTVMMIDNWPVFTEGEVSWSYG